jgi:hypothetical protein
MYGKYGRAVGEEPCIIINRKLHLHKATQCNQLWLLDKQTQTDPEIRDRSCNRFGNVSFLKNKILRLLDDSKTNDLIEVQVNPDALKRQTHLADKQTQLLGPDVWELQQKQQGQERLLQIKEQEEKVELQKLAHSKELLEARDRSINENKQNRSRWTQRMLLGVLSHRLPASAKFVPVPPQTQQSQSSRPRCPSNLPPLPFTGKMDIVEGF